MVRIGQGTGPLDQPGEPPRQGTQRNSMGVNTLLLKAELGKVKTITTTLPTEEFAYGLSRPRDAEGAREVTLKWVEHQPNPDAKPGPDFKAMNFLASVNDITTANEQRDFRAAHPKTLKQGSTQSKLKQHLPLPSDNNSDFTYGRQSAARPLEETRLTGPTPHIKNVVQGSFQQDWVHKNMQRQEFITSHQTKMHPNATKASEGHATKAKAALDPVEKEPWKIKKFSKVQAKTNSYNEYKVDEYTSFEN
eukprot:CAMPEP_0196579448 /NCGR_PEP_ID=MMETSP1081-20130531/22006_1 /TAXON_ID=36882 /ORGANISM="Pyramimonas amylifera, Strain CCMP720" /LENGTH=248 /DNA_ID=CAMNT_0041899051 /DNA_START=6 /DNA_END=752 /DNA_ORIENTATION=-